MREVKFEFQENMHGNCKKENSHLAVMLDVSFCRDNNTAIPLNRI